MWTQSFQYLSVWNQNSLWLPNGSILHLNCFMTGIDGILQSLRITVMQRYIPAEAGAVSSPPFYSPTLALSLSAVLRSLVLLHFSCNTHPDLSLCLRSVSSLEIICTSLLLASVACVSDCVCERVCVCRSAWHKPSSSDIHITPHSTSSPPPPLKGTVNRYSTHEPSRFMDWTITREKGGRVEEGQKNCRMATLHELQRLICIYSLGKIKPGENWNKDNDQLIH